MSNAYCCVPMCTSLKRRNPEITFHKFPTSGTVRINTKLGNWETVNRREAWIKALRIGKAVSSHMKVCSQHFESKDFFIVRDRRNLKKSAVPSLNLPAVIHGMYTSNLSTSSTVCKRAERLETRNRLKVVIEQPVSENHCETLQDNTFPMDLPNAADLEAADTLLTLLHTESQATSIKSFRDFEVQVNTGKKSTLCDFITSPKSLTTITGLYNQALLDLILESVQMIYTDKRLHKLCLYQRIVLTFVKLKWNLSYSILGILFGISGTLCQSYITCMIKLVAKVLKCAITFPSPVEISQNMPICFEHFQDTQIILDCTEIKTQTPKCLCCRIRFYSHYKGTQTIKFMTGVSPAGLITFVSKAYGGRASDKVIFEQSKLIDMLGDKSAVMVDKGFLIEDICRTNGIKLYRPPFMRSKQQLEEHEVHFNRRIAAARVHIERTNQRIKVFKVENCLGI